mgnify:CR=1 FL=1
MPQDRFRLTLAQLDPTLGDLAGNAAKARTAWAEGRAAGADLVALPEMFLSGYQPRDLVCRPSFLDAVEAALGGLAQAVADGPPLAVGAPFRHGGRVFNGYHLLSGGRIAARVAKHHLPNDGVFDEPRVFAAGAIAGPVAVGPMRIGMPVCEDAWYDDVTEAQAESGAEMLLVPNGSPYHRGKQELRQSLMVARVIETGLPLVYLNLTGGQDDQVFDGASFVLNPGGALAAQLPRCEECVAHVDFERGDQGWRARPGLMAPLGEDLEADYQVMVTALGDYLRKSGFAKVLLGLSGGIDSALVATIAADTLGPENVRCVLLPSEYTSPASLEDAAAVARALGCGLDEVAIDAARRAVAGALDPLFAGHAPDVTEENVQSRLRGLLLMAISNKLGGMLLTTGNKSELAVGYATIYGDMAGGYNPIKDLYKSRVFEIARWRNATHRPWMQAPAGEVIPPRVIDKPPSAELAPDQRDEDSLPPYAVLDPILEGLIDREAPVAELVAGGHDARTVRRVEALIHASEWKRQQAAPGARLSRRAFGPDRRYPIVNRFRDRGSEE